MNLEATILRTTDMLKTITHLTVVLLLLCAPPCFADAGAGQMAARITAQLSTLGRDKYDKAKDPGRKPVESMEFYGVKAGMTVLDMIAGAGYNSEILSAAVGPSGTVYAQNSHLVVRLIGGAHHNAMIARLKNDRLANVRYLVVDNEDMPFENSIDMAFWGMNMHDIYNRDGEAATLKFLLDVKRALKPGGIFAMSDHIGATDKDNAELHRIDPQIMLDLITKTGFTIEQTSNLLGNPDDDHTQSVYADGLRYNTDRLIARARKPD
jgi:predicted methyltransferase